MTLVLVQNEGLPKEISENMVHLPKKKNFFFGELFYFTC